MEHYSAIKRNEALTRASTQMNLENSQTQNVMYFGFHFYEMFRIGKHSTETKSSWVVFGGCGGGRKEEKWLLLVGRVSFWSDENVQEYAVVMVAQNWECAKWQFTEH